jgi:hypothetical protein
MLSVELTHLADVLDAVKQRPDVSANARQLSKRISAAIWNTTVRASSLWDFWLTLTLVG